MSSKQLKIAVNGAGGRMGSRIIALACEDPALRLAAAFEAPKHPLLGKDAGETAGCGSCGVGIVTLAEGAPAFDVLIDFSQPDAAVDAAQLCVKAKKAAVICTTGLSPAQQKKVQDAAAAIAVIHASNTSLGMNILFHLAEQTARLMPDSDVELLETHHHHKKDAPSGSALTLASAVNLGRGRPLKRVFGREGAVGARKPDEMGISALRGGDVTGDHTVFYFGDGERLELTHRAHSRDTFAAGALRAAKWLAGKKPGLYSMKDVLGLPA